MDAMNQLNLFTSESVSEGHPDKLADQISDAVLDECLRQDPNSRVACEALVGNNLIVVAGEITSKAKLDYESLARDVACQVGYVSDEVGLDGANCQVLVNVHEQSPDIALGVDIKGAGDQGLMFGYATHETQEFMPLGIQLSHLLTRRLAYLRKEGGVSFLRPDSKSQVSVRYENGMPKNIHSVVVSTQHTEDISIEELRKFVKEKVVDHVLASYNLSRDLQVWINPTGRFVVGGPKGDVGLTGRKIISDTYGGHGAHGGGAFSGKDPSKVDRSASYACRHIAKNIVAAGFAKRCLVQVAYAIGKVDPVGFCIETYGTGTVNDRELERVAFKLWDLSPQGIIDEFSLREPKYFQTATYGHFGRGEFSWESLNKVERLKELCSSSCTDVSKGFSRASKSHSLFI